MKMREFRRQHKQGVRIWQIWVELDTIYTCHGWQGGKIQQGEDRPGKTTRETAEERAISRANKAAKDKMNKGYTEYVPGSDMVIGDEAGTEVTFDGPPPDGLEVFKPNTMPKKGSSEAKKMAKVIERGDEIITRKYNGMKHLLTVSREGDIGLYTRRMEDATDNYPWLIEEFGKLGLPLKTIIAVELVVPNGEGPEDFRSMQRLARSNPEKAQRLQVENPKMRPHAILLAPVYWRGEPLIKQMRVMDWMGVLDKCVSEARKRVKRIHAMKVFYGGLESAFEHVKETGIEGLVVYDGEACFAEKEFNFLGSAKRPQCWKQKLIFEEDFIAVWDPYHHSDFPKGGEFGSGSNMQLPKSLALYQYDSRGELVYICSTSGMDRPTRKLIASPVSEQGGWWSAVVAVEYAERKFLKEGDISNALTFPAFQKVHEDKAPTECVNEKL